MATFHRTSARETQADQEAARQPAGAQLLVLVSDIVHDDSEELLTMGPPHSDTFPPDTDGHRSVSHLTITACTL